MKTATHGVLAEIEQLDYQISVDDPAYIVLRTHLLYDLHVRPTTNIYTALRDIGVVDQLALRRAGVGVWVDFEPLSLLALSLRRGEAIQVRIRAPIAKPALLAIMDAFRSCPLFRDYTDKDRLSTPHGNGLDQNETEQFRREFDSPDDRSCLVKLNIENFLIFHAAEIEAHVLMQHPERPPTHDELDANIGDLLEGGFEQFGIMSLDVPYDNLMQLRDMCYHLHFKQIERHQRIPYTLINIEWSKEFGPNWRRQQGLRQRYFFEREAAYYRNLILLLLRRDPQMLAAFVSTWKERLDESLRLRNALREEMQKFATEMDNFTPNFDNPEEFRNHIRVMGQLVVKNVSRLTLFVQLLRDERLWPTEPRANGLYRLERDRSKTNTLS